MKIRICDIWDMELPEVGGNPWFLDWVARAPKHAGDHLTVSKNTFEALVDTGIEFFSIREYFGGIGAHAVMLEDIFEPGVHTVADYAPEAVQHLKSVLPGVNVEQADAYKDRGGAADLVVLDFGDLTVFKAQPGTPRGDLLDRVFLEEPAAVVITDIAARYLHLQKTSYEPLLGPGACDSYEEYLDRFAEYLSTRFGYTMLEGNYTRWSCVMAFVAPGVSRQGQFNKLPPGGTPGLVVL